MSDGDQARDPGRRPEAPATATGDLDALHLLDRGDSRRAVAALMDAHGDAIFAFCARILCDRQAAEDVSQQVFLEAMRDIGSFQQRASPRTWLFRIAAHRCQDALRKRRGRLASQLVHDDEAGAAAADPAPGPRDRIEQRQLLSALDDCLEHLSEEVRMTVMLKFQTDMSYEAMAAQLGTKADTLNRRVQRAMPALADCLERRGWADG